jgi:starch phosphorylase
MLDPEALTICFARRFATYKRATLLFREPDRLANLLGGQSDRPVQLIFSGKAHPADDYGKELIRNIVQHMKEEPFRNRIVFIEDYDINIARYMVQGADVWLNNPRRPLEACGTSGMKAAANGTLNVSVLDGWWDEGFLGDNGWAIGSGEEYDNPVYQDDIESRALYDILEESVRPLFYDRVEDDIPREWVRMMKRSIRTICPEFNSHRMVSDYIENCYVPSAKAYSELKIGNFAALKEMVQWQNRLSNDWKNINIKAVDIKGEVDAVKGKKIEVAAIIDTAGHRPHELKVELLHGPIDIWQNFKVRHITRLEADLAGPESNGDVIFSGHIPLSDAGLYGYVIRISAEHPNLPFSRSLDLVRFG